MRLRNAVPVTLVLGVLAVASIAHAAPLASRDTHAGAVACTITGTKGTDTLKGTAGADVICGKDGADTIYGKDGGDQIYGGSGPDQIFGGDGNDQIWATTAGTT